MKRAMTIVGVTVSALLGGSGLALADSGQFVKFDNGAIVFYIGTAGDARGNNFPGANAQQRVCGDAIFNAPQQFFSELREDVSFAPDPVLTSMGAAYRDPNRCSPTAFTAGDKAYYVNLNWAAASGAQPGRENGSTDHVP